MADEKINSSEEFSILYLYERGGGEDEIPAFFQDLNLLQIMDKMCIRWGRRIREYYRYPAKTQREAAYRHGVYCDIKKDALYDSLVEYTEDLARIDELRKEKERAAYPLQKAVWHIREVAEYCRTYGKLEKAFSAADPASDGLKEFHKILKEILW